ncbi:hypothetical protein [Peristeroidobacter soli]|uniref:hypothetical protein n=1 Tax=Peristeroidobacter soli TaxID=2497877 RepID=UPI0013003C4D|nr:hypothetical protein [Peristeroidobacter soli]
MATVIVPSAAAKRGEFSSYDVLQAGTVVRNNSIVLSGVASLRDYGMIRAW